jgi:hypothetical protein
MYPSMLLHLTLDVCVQYGKAVAADAPVGWWRLDYATSTPSDFHSRPSARMQETSCISCSGPSRSVTTKCSVDQSWCAARMDPSVSFPIAGIPNTEALARRAGSAYVPSPTIAEEFSPAGGEGVSAASGGGSVAGSGMRFNGYGGLSIAYSAALLNHTSFTLQFWLRLGAHYVSAHGASNASCAGNACRCDAGGVPEGPFACNCSCTRAPGATRQGREQTLASCGWVMGCSEHGDAHCQAAARAGVNHGWELIVKRNGRLTVRLATKTANPSSSFSSSSAAAAAASSSKSSSRSGGSMARAEEGGRLGRGVLELQMSSDVLTSLSDAWTLVSLVVDERGGGGGRGRGLKQAGAGGGGHGMVALYLNASLAVSAPLPLAECESYLGFEVWGVGARVYV